MKYASSHYKDEEVYISGSSRDPFQGYGESGNFERCVILDEFRPGLLQYNDLLRILDPYIKGTVAAGSRYSDKYLMADTIIITTPFSPQKFYDRYNLDDQIDSLDQLLRRISACVEFTPDNLFQRKGGGEYSAIIYEKPNKYISGSQLETIDIVDEL